MPGTPALPVLPGPPPARGRRRWLLPVVVLIALVSVLGVAAAVVGGVVVYQRMAAPPVYTRIADPCAVPQLPSPLDDAPPHRYAPFADTIRFADDHVCIWQHVSRTSAAQLEVWVQHWPKDTNQIRAAQRIYAIDLVGVGQGIDPTGPDPQARQVDGLGDEALTTIWKDDIEAGGNPPIYSVGGAIVVTRSRNVVVQVRWMAGTYRADDPRADREGTELPYGPASQQAIAIAHTILAHFS